MFSDLGFKWHNRNQKTSGKCVKVDQKRSRVELQIPLRFTFFCIVPRCRTNMPFVFYGQLESFHVPSCGELHQGSLAGLLKAILL